MNGNSTTKHTKQCQQPTTNNKQFKYTTCHVPTVYFNYENMTLVIRAYMTLILIYDKTRVKYLRKVG